MRKHLLVWLSLLTAIVTQAQVSRETTEQKIDSLLPVNTARLITPIRLQTAFRKVLDYVQPNIANGGLSPLKLSSGGATSGQVLKWNGSAWVPSADAVGSSPTWGSITGTLSTQTDLQATLNGKANTSHTHLVGDLTQSGATTGQVIKWNGSAWMPSADAVGSSPTWGSITGTLSTQSDLNSALAGKEPLISTGTITQYRRGDKTWQTLDKSAVGLANVDNTSDANKPVSTATQTALNGKANTSHTHLVGDLTQSGATTGQVIKWNGVAWAAANQASNNDQTLNIRDFGAVGDGVTNDVAAIQSALNAAATLKRRVIGNKGDVYLVLSQGTKNFMTSSVTGLAYCLEIPTGVTFDLRGATLKSNSDAVIISNKLSATNTDTDIVLENGVLDGGSVLLIEKPFIFFYGVTGLVMRNITVQNTKHLVSTLTNIANSYFDNLTAKNVVGNSWQFGLPTVGQDVRDSYIGSIFSYDITPESEPMVPGNGFIGNLVRCTVGTIFCRNVGSGVKIQQGSHNITINTVDIRLTNNTNLNSGFKIQGTSGENVYNVVVGTVKASEQRGCGLYVEYAKDVRISQYFGENNAITGEYPDFWLSGVNTSVDNVWSKNSGGTGVLVRADATRYQLGNVTVIESGNAVNSSAVFLSGGSEGVINTLNVQDEQATKTTQFALNVSANTCKGFIGNISATGLSSSSLMAFMGAGGYVFGTLRLTTAQRNDMVIPVAGFSYYDTTTNTYVRYNGTSWVTY